jgi:hypothetical protein
MNVHSMSHFVIIMTTVAAPPTSTVCIRNSVQFSYFVVLMVDLLVSTTHVEVNY